MIGKQGSRWELAAGIEPPFYRGLRPQLHHQYQRTYSLSVCTNDGGCTQSMYSGYAQFRGNTGGGESNFGCWLDGANKQYCVFRYL